MIENDCPILDPIITITSSTVIIPISAVQFGVSSKNKTQNNNNNNNNNSNNSLTINFTAPSAIDAQTWIESICAVRTHLSLSPEERMGNTREAILRRYRLDLLQLINQQHQQRGIFGLRLPKDAMQMIAFYTMKK